MSGYESSRFSPAAKQVLVCSAVYLSFFAKGTSLGFLTVLTPQLHLNTSTITPSIEEESWIVSIHGLFYLPSALFIPFFMQSKGRRMAFRIINIPTVFAWLIIYFADNSTWLIVAGALHGFQMSGILLVGPIAVGEYTTPKYRGVLLVVKDVLFFVGIWFANALGSYVYWRTLSLFLFPLPLLILILTLSWPETPIWLASKGKFEDAEKSFRWLRGTDAYDETELIILLDVQRTAIEKSKENQSKDNFFQTLNKKVRRKDFQRSMTVFISLFTLIHLSGRLVLASYFLVVLVAMTKSESIAYSVMHISNPTNIAAMVLSIYLVKRIRRRPLLFSTSALGATFLILTSLMLFLQRADLITKSPYFVLTPFFLYLISTSIGPALLPTVLYGEVLPMDHKDLGNSISMIYVTFLHWGSHMILPYFLIHIGAEGTFLFFAISILICTAVLYKFLPESYERTLQEIEDYYNFGCFIKREVTDSVNLVNKTE